MKITKTELTVIVTAVLFIGLIIYTGVKLALANPLI